MHETVLYGSNGACTIDNVEQGDHGKYYILTPVHKARTKFMVPVENETLVSRMRPLPSAEAVRDSIDQALSSELVWIDDNGKRKEHAKQILENGSEFELLVLVRSFHAHKQKVIERGKKTTSSDSSILRSAQEHIRDEFSIVLNIEPDEVDRFIDARAQAVALA